MLRHKGHVCLICYELFTLSKFKNIFEVRYDINEGAKSVIFATIKCLPEFIEFITHARKMATTDFAKD